ncbi:MAG: hypothetical protein ACR652_18930 [Methylocystis sp.]|uniref:hypothetical protein n=1 Tax=Methylocystis sp. TaxID=1911079 RepID=UPI003DA3E928
MGNINFYTHARVLSRVSEDTKVGASNTLSNAVAQLRERGVARSDSVITLATPRLGVAANPSAGLAKTLGKTKAKANAIAANFSNPAVKTKFANRLADNPAGAKDLKKLLHYKGRQSAASAGARLQTRAALSLAFAHGASSAELSNLRQFLDGCGDDVRSNVLTELNSTHRNAGAFIESLLDPDAFNPAKDLNSNAINGMYGVFEPAAQLYINDLLVGQNVDLDSTAGMRNAAILGSISCYCENGYGWMNDALRSGKELPDEEKNIIKTAAFVLGQLPDWQGLTMRGADLPPDVVDRYQPGATVTEKAFTSASADAGYKRNVQFIIESKHGKDVSHLSGKKGDTDGIEIMYRPNTQFDVLHKEKIGEITYIVMREAD